MDIAILFATALTVAPASGPECGVVGLLDIDRAAYAVVNGMVGSVAADGQPSVRFFAEPLASALGDEQRRPERGEAPRLGPDWLSGGGSMDAVRDTSLYSLNRSGVDDIVMGLGFTNAEGEAVYRRLHLGCHEGLWRIESIFLHPEGAFLNDLLAGEP
ncbi:hypothetical protein [Brevundimonas sp.]|uniref:hypothetical protein n=1 Tax=Brevundimonas sp. TaxID=1871086 RepID=UPI002D2FD060|nr:hypothetical protein [Brevundimonas sp.]HYC66900.1 hypothetical protein [Brevundimonas sp.]